VNLSCCTNLVGLNLSKNIQEVLKLVVWFSHSQIK